MPRNWMDRLRQKLPSKQTRWKAKRRQVDTEVLEERTYLSVTSLFSGGELQIVSDGPDTISVGTDPLSPGAVQVTVNGTSDPTLGTVQASTVTSLVIVGSDSDNTIDLSGLLAADYSFFDAGTGLGIQISVDGDDGNDTIIGSADLGGTLLGGNGADTITGSIGNDSIRAGDGADSVIAGDGNDTVLGGDGNDIIDAGTGDDSIDGGDGGDSIVAGDGADSITGGDGPDTVDGGLGNDDINGMSGLDSLIGGDGDDTLRGGADGDVISGDAGNDVAEGNSGNDTINGGVGSDQINAGSGDDVVEGDAGADTLNGAAGNDAINGGSESDRILGGGGNDTISGGTDGDTIRGQSGDDVLFGGGGADSLDGGTGNDLIDGVGAFAFISDVSITEGNAGRQAAVLTVSLTQPTITGLMISFVTVSGTAITGQDFLATSGVLTFGPSETSKTISVTVLGDRTGEGSESFFVDLTTTSSVGISDARGEITIIDDDVLVSVNDVTQTETNGTTTFDFTVTLNGVPQNSITVDYEIGNGNALGGFDFVSTTGSVIVAPGIISTQLSVSVTGDFTAEDDENFFVNILPSSEYALADGQGVGTILNDDGALPFGVATNFDLFGIADAQHWVTTATDGTPGFNQGDAITLTWGIVPDGTVVPNDLVDPVATTASDLIAQLDVIYNETATGPDVRNRTWFALFQQVFDEYSANSGITYVFEPNDDGVAGSTAPGVLGVRPDVRIGGATFVPPIGVLGRNRFPDDGDMVIDAADPFFSNPINLAQNSIGLRYVLAHEHGHGLGQRHVVGQTSPNTPGVIALMNPVVGTPPPVDGPQEFDILVTQRQYGDPNERGVGGNDSVADATIAGLVDAVTPISITGNSIDSNTDTDVYQFTVTTDLTVSIDLSPTGSTVNAGPGESGSPNPGTTFNMQTLNDLGLELIDSDGATVLASSFVHGFGQSELITEFTLPAAGDYSLRITGTQDSPQAYSLTVTIPAVVVVPPAQAGDLLPDTLIGGTGSDTLSGADSNDLLIGNAGDDLMGGGGGNDTLLGGAGRDTLDGGAGNDTVDGQGGADVLFGGDGDDTFVWDGQNDGDDIINTDAGGDTLSVGGKSTDDTFTVSQSGASELIVSQGTGSVSVTGFGLEAGIEAVIINGGSGNDTVTITDIDQVGALVMTVNGGSGGDTISASGASIGNVRLGINGQLGDDTLTGSADADTITGGDGNDDIAGENGDDTLSGNAGADLISGGDGNDVVDGNDGNDTALGDAGDDSLLGSFGNDMLTGDVGNDTIDGGFGDDLLNGMSGNDSLLGNFGNDRIAGGSGDDTINGGNDNDTIQGHSGADLIDGSHGDDLILGQAGNDTVFGDDGNDTIMGGNGNDVLYGEDGDDVVDGEGASDTIVGGDGNDTLRGGGSDDTILGQDGDDVVNGNSGNDTASTGEGADTISNVETIDENFVLSSDLMQDFDTLASK
ncbi:MAG: Calx-beta domain-containing protein [Planctomycetales bacterium]